MSSFVKPWKPAEVASCDRIPYAVIVRLNAYILITYWFTDVTFTKSKKVFNMHKE